MIAPVCKPEDKAQIVPIKNLGVKTYDFTNSSRGCLEHYASGISKGRLVYVAESGSTAWKNATVEAAKIDEAEGIRTAVMFAPDRDGDPKTAETYVWAMGNELTMAPRVVKDGFTVDMIVAVDGGDSMNEIHDKGHAIYNKYLAVPPIALNQN